MTTAELLLTQLSEDARLDEQVNELVQSVKEQKKAGVLVVINGQPETIKAAYIAQLAINKLNEDKAVSYTCMTFFLDDECYTGISKTELISKLGLKQAVELNIEEALEELILEAEYSYKKLGMSRHMSIPVKQKYRLKIAESTAEMMALDMNLYLVL